MAAVSAENSTLVKAKSLSQSSSKALLKSCGKSENRTCSEISFKDFLDFLHTSYQINGAIEGVPNDLTDKVDIDWQSITMNEFISSFLMVKKGSSNPKAIQDNINKMSDSEHLKSLMQQSRNISDSSICDTLEGNMLVGTKDVKSDASSEMLERNIESEVSDIVTNNKNDMVEEDRREDSSMNVMDHATKPLPTEEMALDLKKTSSMVTSGQQKNKLLMLGQQTGNKWKMMSSRKGVLFDCKVKTTDEENNKCFEHLMKRKLNEVIQEGLLDSILPYVVPKQTSAQPAAKKSSNSGINKSLSLTSLDKSASGQFSKDKMAGGSNRRKSTTE